MTAQAPNNPRSRRLWLRLRWSFCCFPENIERRVVSIGYDRWQHFLLRSGPSNTDRL